MNSLWLILIGIAAFVIAYIGYGSWLAKQWGIDNKRETPAHTKYDGIDYVPTKAPILLGHHFASIAGAGPITGPIQAAVFGWVPVFLWVIIGSIFVGGVQDFGSLFASIRHEGKSIGQIIEDNIGRTGKKLFIGFAWLTLLLVIAAFTDICAKTFTSVPQAGTASLLFIVLAVLFGYFVYRKGAPLWISTIVGVALLFFCVWIGYVAPLTFSANAATNIIIWDIILLIYISVASIVPVWILLQPRDYLNSFLLYAMLAGAVIGIIVMRPALQLVPFAGFAPSTGNFLFPMLFVTVACGAISGFHSLISSGTTSKQLDKESDAKLIGYGAMLIEGTLAIVSICAAGYFATAKYGELMKSGGPNTVFALGCADFMAVIGVPVDIGKIFVSLALSAFALTSLDTATRIGRFIFQEFFEKFDAQGKPEKSILTNRYFATIVTVVPGGILAFMGYSKIWPIFGSANQLLAALALLGLSSFLIKMGKNAKMILVPMVFMFVVTFSALILVIKNNLATQNYMLLVIAAALFILAIILVAEAWKVFSGKRDTSIKA